MRPRHRHLPKILGALLLTALPLFLYLKVSDEPPAVYRWYERAALRVVSPFFQISRAIQQGVGGVARRYFFLTGVARENEGLRKLVDALQIKRSFYEGVARENERLTALVEFRKKLPLETLAARVLSCPPLGEFRIITVDRGEQEGVRRGAAVMVPQGLVGRVIRVGGRFSEILLLTDPTSAVDARAVRTGARGLVTGEGIEIGLDRRLFIGALEFWDRTEVVAEGDFLVTSGLDGLFPPDLPIGTVREVRKGKYEVFQEGKVIPQVDFNQLREVLIVKSP